MHGETVKKKNQTYSVKRNSTQMFPYKIEYTT